MREIFAKFSLDDNTIDFIGHAIALFTNDTYLDEPAIDCIAKI
jgi:Rab GDP dissociation inhibitor